jgi:hypothetical protein
MTHLVFMVEELSIREVLQALVPRIVPATSFQVVPHEGRSDLEASLPRKLRAWRTPDTLFVVMEDNHSRPCLEVKKHLAGICQRANRSDTLIRIVCRELESWFLGDLEAVAKAFGRRSIVAHRGKRRYQQPDDLPNACDVLRRLIPEYSKIAGARLIAPHLSLDENRSHSFRVFVAGLRRLATTITR